MPDLFPWSIAATAIAAAIGAVIKMVEFKNTAKNESKEHDMLRSEIAEFKKCINANKQDATDSLTKPLQYPRL